MPPALGKSALVSKIVLIRVGWVEVSPASKFIPNSPSTRARQTLTSLRSRSMKRSLRRRIERRINQSWTTGFRYDRGTLGLVLIFPEEAFAEAPRWTPGPGFRALNNDGITNTAFIRDNGDGTQTVVVPDIQAEGPATDGGPLPDTEVWTVTAPVDDFDGTGLGNSVHGITFMRHVPNAVIKRERYTTHPLAAVEAYWHEFERTWGFLPSGEHRGEGWPFGQGREWAYFICRPQGARPERDEVALLNAALRIARHFGAKVRVYPYNLQARTITGPLDSWDTDLSTVTRRLGKR
ncbi:hypothetical protein [Streptomyces niveus]|uniref:hypothetical protein n=1 Tax=Streptomyces niveus TaxID=193462 RepID=UPI00341385BF